MPIYQNYPTELFDNLKQVYHASAEKYGNKTLFMQKKGNAYAHFGFCRYRDDVNALGTALLARGIVGCVLLVGESCYEWVTAYMAVIAGVGTVVPVDRERGADFLAGIAARCRACAVIYSNGCADRVARMGEEVKKIPFSDLEALIEEGKLRIEAGDRSYLDADIDPHAMAALLFASGTAESAKGVMLSHHNLCFQLSEVCKMIYVDQKDVFLSVLPMHHIYECTCGFLCAVYRGCTLAFGGGLSDLTRQMRWVRPTVMLGIPLLIERLYQRIQSRICERGAEKAERRAVALTQAIGSYKLRMLAKRKFFWDIHQSFGGRLRLLISGGGVIDPAVLRGLREWGINVLQGYGRTECAPIVAVNRDGYYKDGSVGIATPKTLLDVYAIQDDGVGEIRFRGENLMLGYYGDAEATANAIRGGWFYTGDMGYIDVDGFLYLMGSKQNLIVGEKGRQIFPEELEAYLNAMPFVRESVVVGCYNAQKGAHEAVALIYPNYPALTERYGQAPTAAQLDLEMRKAVSEVNAKVLPYKRIADCLLRTEEFPKNTSRMIKREGLAEQAHAEYQRKREAK